MFPEIAYKGTTFWAFVQINYAFFTFCIENGSFLTDFSLFLYKKCGIICIFQIFFVTLHANLW